MLSLLIIACGSIAVWFLADRILAPLDRWKATAGTGQSFPVRLGNLFFSRLNRRETMRNYVSRLGRSLSQAGRPGGGESCLAEAEGIGLAAALVILVLLTLSTGGLGIGSLLLSLLMGVITTWLMLARVGNLITERRKLLNRQFPYFLDLAVMSMESGTGMLEVIDAFTQSTPGAALSQELNAVTTDIRMGSTVDAALMGLEGRVPSEDLISVSRSIRQGLRMGTPLSQVFREQAESMRFKRSQNAERSAEELKVKLQGPAMLLVLAVLVLVLGPAIVGMATGGF